MNAPALNRAQGINHVAYRCRDAEQTRWFYEDVLGLKLAAGLVSETVPGLGEQTPYMHLFFELGNGEYVAFFDEPHGAKAENFQRAHSFDRHLALEVADEQQLLAWQKRINSLGVSCLGPLDHGFVKSVYMYDPNGLQVELTCRTSAFASTMAAEAATAREVLAAWSERTREVKNEKFGAAAVAQRSRRA